MRIREMDKSIAWDRVGIRRLMMYVEKRIRRMFYEGKLKCNTHQARMNLMERCAAEVLQDVQDRKGLFWFFYEIDDSKLKASIIPRKGSSPIILDLKLVDKEQPRWWNRQTRRS